MEMNKKVIELTNELEKAKLRLAKEIYKIINKQY